ncbi:hypothetical protein MKK37_11240, partial [Staphylococcus epidermidis]|uniref:hypothetical protein n=1 Tax=Staphylococcus epidermidis TaxID=1282 RepID=UPI001F0686D3
MLAVVWFCKNPFFAKNFKKFLWFLSQKISKFLKSSKTGFLALFWGGVVSLYLFGFKTQNRAVSERF